MYVIMHTVLACVEGHALYTCILYVISCSQGCWGQPNALSLHG